MAESDAQDVTRILQEWRDGDSGALDRLMPLVYDQLRRLAKDRMLGERAGHTLQPTALVHEAYARLVDASVAWEGRVHFYAVAARAMRQVLVEHARARGRRKRGGDWRRTTLDDAAAVSPPAEDFLDLADALERLAGRDERSSRLIELRYLAGLPIRDVAEVLGVSAATVHRDLAAAKAFLREQLTDRDEAP
jgi:RNA polymerase sigma factor (TIGR02999 family)